MTEQPIETIPKDRKILVKHEYIGWVEANYSHDEFWVEPCNHRRFAKMHFLAWAELPEEAE